MSAATSRAPSRFTSQTATWAPSAARRRHVAAPMPLAPPVTIAIWPSSLTGEEPILRGRDAATSRTPLARASADVGMDRAADPVPRACVAALRRRLHRALSGGHRRLYRGPGRDQAGVHGGPRRLPRGRGERDPAGAADGPQLRAAARR